RLVPGPAVPSNVALATHLAASPSPPCAALRNGRVVVARGAAALNQCELCAGVADHSVCSPLLAGGEVIGSVLVLRDRAFGADEEREIAAGIAQAAPVLANLRNLAVAEA